MFTEDAFGREYHSRRSGAAPRDYVAWFLLMALLCTLAFRSGD